MTILRELTGAPNNDEAIQTAIIAAAENPESLTALSNPESLIKPHTIPLEVSTVNAITAQLPKHGTHTALQIAVKSYIEKNKKHAQEDKQL